MKLFKRIILCLTILSIFSVLGFYIYASDYYKADDIALSLYQNDPTLVIEDQYLIVPSAYESNITFIFYPGAKVEYYAYLPLCKKLSYQGITTIMMRMPLNFAFLNANAADDILHLLPEDESVYMIGHSLGGAMASDYASQHDDFIDGLILLGSYNYGQYNDFQTLTIYGSFNDNLSEHIEGSSNVVLIEGGNHAQFGNYGEQKGDPKATISSEMQQEISISAILDFIRPLN